MSAFKHTQTGGSGSGTPPPSPNNGTGGTCVRLAPLGAAHERHGEKSEGDARPRRASAGRPR